jgi:hypothetical protein
LIGALKRSRHLFLIAFLFRLQLYVFGFPTSPASELLRVDILNCMGMAMLVFAPVSLLTAWSRALWCAALGLLIAVAAPFATQWDSPAIPWLLRSYFAPSLKTFGFFPWGSFLAFGIAAGTLLRIVDRETLGKVMMAALPLGIIAAAAAYCTPNLHILPVSDYWLNSPALIFIKLGTTVAVLGFSYIWVNRVGNPSKWSLFRQLGTTSLIVYWVHIEVVYGRWFGIWKEELNVPEVLVFTAILIWLMTRLSIWQTRDRGAGTSGRTFWSWFQSIPQPQPEPSRASGD